MKTKIIIKTPQGNALGTQKKIKPLIIGFKKVKIDTYVNKEDDEMVWDVEGSVRDIININRNVARFDSLIKNIFNNRMVKKKTAKHLTEEDQEKLKDMLLNQTSCEVIKEATAQELVEADKTWWQRMKETFTKKEEDV